MLDANGEMELTHVTACPNLDFHRVDLFGAKVPALIRDAVGGTADRPEPSACVILVGMHLCGILDLGLILTFHASLGSTVPALLGMRAIQMLIGACDAMACPMATGFRYALAAAHRPFRGSKGPWTGALPLLSQGGAGARGVCQGPGRRCGPEPAPLFGAERHRRGSRSRERARARAPGQRHADVTGHG